MKGHYLVLLLPDGREAVRREYVQLEHEDETIDEAVERWLRQHPRMAGRRRNREKTARAILSTVISRGIARPTSWYEQRARETGKSFPVPVGRTVRR